VYHYQFNIGDYKKDTAHLSLLEHGIYRMLIDSYYTNEGPLPADDAKLMRTHCIRTADEQQAYRNVVDDFFELRDGEYFHAGCQKVMAKIYDKSAKAKESAEKRWASKNKGSKAEECEVDANAMRTHSEGNANGMLPGTHNPVPITQVKPPKPPRKKSPEVDIKTFIEQCDESGEDPVPITDPVFKNAEKLNLPPEFLAICWRRFVEKNSESKKKYIDWRAAFRNAVNDNWYKLWWLSDDGSYQLTTAGKQAQKLQGSQS